MRLTFVFPPGRVRRLDAARRGAAPTEFFFGAVEAENYSTVQYIEVDPGPSRWNRLRVALRLLRRLPQSDCLVVVEEKLALPLALASRMLGSNVPVVSIRCRISKLQDDLPANMTNWLLKKSHSVVLSAEQVEEFQLQYGLDSQHASFCEFGVDASFWFPTINRSDISDAYVLAIGDSGRDYKTLLMAAPQLSVPCRIVSKSVAKAGVSIPRGTILAGNWRTELISDHEIRDYYQKAACVVIPLDALAEDPVGQSVCLQAMSCGIPVVMTKIPRAWSKELKHEENVVLVEANNASELASQVNRLIGDRKMAQRIGAAGRALVENRLNIANFSHQLLQICAGSQKGRKSA